MVMSGRSVNLATLKPNFGGSNTDGSFTTAVSNLFLNPLERIPNYKFRIIWVFFFFFILKMVCCVYSLESPR